MTHHADVDIDFANRDAIVDLLDCTPAMQLNKGVETKHNTGVYIQPIPTNPITGLCSLTFKEADERGYFKLDFLNVHVYRHIRDYKHYDDLMARTPPWHRLAEKEFVEQLIHISNYYKVVAEMMPDTIPRLAMFLSAIRPAKKHLLGKDWKTIAETIWEKSDDGYSFKHAHAVSYAVLVALHMNIIDEIK